MSHCIICGSSELSTLIDYQDYPYFTVPVALEDKQKILSSYAASSLVHDLRIGVCSCCGHCQHGTIPDFEVLNDLYSNYYSYPSPLENNYEPVRDNQFLEVFFRRVPEYDPGQSYKTVYEIGCYDGYILYHLQERGYSVEGCDPSAGALIGCEYGVKIHRELFDPEQLKIQYDVVISRHYLEHVANPSEWVNSISKAVSDKGLLVIEVPNVEFYLKNGLTEVFSHQHIHGFSPDSIRHLLGQQGIEVKEVIESDNNLIVFGGKHADKKALYSDSYKDLVESFIDTRQSNQARAQEVLDQFQGKSIAIWGAGSFGVSVAYSYQIALDSIELFIDSDPAKHAKEYISIDKKIVSPASLKYLSIDLIIVASMYSQNIIENIRETAMQIPVLSLYPHIELIND